jgi:beta-glucosidase
MNGRPLSITWPAKHVPSIVEAWFLGVETGNAVADVLFGDMNPGGKLCVTFPRSVGQVPIYYNHKNTGRPPSSDPFSSKYLDLPSTPLYPFGFGLSYAMFSYAYLQLDRRTAAPDDTLHVSVEVKNTGKRTGDEVVQLYIRKQYASVTKPVKELKGFRRVMLAPGESQHVKFLLTPSELAFYNQDMRLGVEPGRYTVFVGTNSTDLLESGFEIIRK